MCCIAGHWAVLRRILLLVPPTGAGGSGSESLLMELLLLPIEHLRIALSRGISSAHHDSDDGRHDCNQTDEEQQQDKQVPR